MRTVPAVLVVDDERNLCHIIQVKLRHSGFVVDSAADAASALRKLRGDRFDLVLLDVHLPDADSLEWFDKFRAAAPSAAFVLITAYEDADLRARALEAGAADVLFKPFDLDVMVDRVRAHTAPRSALGSVSVGQQIVLRIAESYGSAEVSARVTVSNGDTFRVAASRPLSGHVHSHVSVRLSGDDGLYQFRTRILDCIASGEVVLAKPEVIHRSQRRRHCRSLLNTPVKMRRDSRTGQGATPIAATSQDVSLGGIGIVVPRSLVLGSQVQLEFGLPGDAQSGRPLEVEGTVVRSDAVLAGAGKVVCRLGVQFAHPIPEMEALLRGYTGE